MTRNEAREAMMQILYEMEAGKSLSDEKGAELVKERIEGRECPRCTGLMEEITGHIDEIDEIINNCSRRWKTSRMAKVDLAILRLATGEIKYAHDVPDVVIINEAVNLAKKYSTEGSSRFVNGVLGAVMNA